MIKVNKRTLCIATLVICKIAIIVYVYKLYKNEILEGLLVYLF